MPSSAMSPGTVLGGRYRLDDLLSEHGGARFWRATDTVLARSVAVHALSSEDPRSAQLLDAARSSAAVMDARFLRVLDCDDVDGITWVINEWGAGTSLDLMLESGPLPPARAAWLAREVADAIVTAHAAGLAHGRLNPEAVLVTEGGLVKVIGFVVDAVFAGTADRDTAFGVISDQDGDVIDLAGILYAALTGRWPGRSGSGVARAPREGRRTLRPRQVRAGVPRTLDTICDRVLNREASQHTAPLSTALEIAAALSDYVGDPAMAAPMDLPAMHIDPDAGAAIDDTATSLPPPLPAALPAALPVPPPAVAEVGPEPVPAPEPEPLPEPRAAATEAPAEGEHTMPHAFADLDPDLLARPADWEPAPPPPPFDQPVERPLFADHDRRIPPGAELAAGADTGGPWLFSEDETTTARPKPPARRTRTILIGLLVLLLAVAMYVAFDLGRSDDTGRTPSTEPTASGSPTSGIPTGTPIKVVRSTDFDPEGDPPTENPDETRFAVDGNQRTGWRTQAYRDDPKLGGLKSGVGLLLDLGTDQAVGSVELDLVGAGTRYEIWATSPGVNDPPADLADLRRVGGQAASASPSVLRFGDPVRTRFVLVWLTELPPISGGRFRGEISEVVLRP